MQQACWRTMYYVGGGKKRTYYDTRSYLVEDWRNGPTSIGGCLPTSPPLLAASGVSSSSTITISDVLPAGGAHLAARLSLFVYARMRTMKEDISNSISLNRRNRKGDQWLWWKEEALSPYHFFGWEPVQLMPTTTALSPPLGAAAVRGN